MPDAVSIATGRLLETHRKNLVFLLGAGAAHLELVGPGLLDRIEVVLGRLVSRFCRDPQHEVVEGQHGDRRQIFPVERHARGERRREQVGERDDDLVLIAAGGLHIEEALRARAARLVDRHDRLFHQVVLGDDSLGEAGHLVRAPAGARRDDELHGSRRFPSRCRGRRKRRHNGDSANTLDTHVNSSYVLGR